MQLFAIDSYAIKRSIKNKLQKLNYADILWIKHKLILLDMINNVKS